MFVVAEGRAGNRGNRARRKVYVCHCSLCSFMNVRHISFVHTPGGGSDWGHGCYAKSSQILCGWLTTAAHDYDHELVCLDEQSVFV